MTNINLSGTSNASAITTPGAYVNVLAPPVSAIIGSPANILGVVGTATWGPVNSPVQGSLAQIVAAFGPMQARRYDLGTPIAAAALQGAGVFTGVRVTDGTDTAATSVILTNCMTLTAKYTGSLGASLKAVLAAGSAAGSFKITLSLPNALPETFDNITGTGNAFWVALAAAINNGQSATRGASSLVVATVGAGVTAPAAATYSFTGGTDGVTTITSATLLGVDTGNRSGMYALRNSGAAIGVLADCADSTTWSTQLAFALSEILQMVDCSPSGDTVAGITATMNTAGVDSPWFKVLLGDWAYFSDTTNAVTRLISPCAYYAGWKVANGPQLSALNKPLLGIVGTQKTVANQTYSYSDLQALSAARVDVISNQSPGGSYYSCIFGRNTSSDNGRHQDAYVTLTNYLAISLQKGGGQFVGALATPDEVREAKSAIGGLLQAMADASPALIGNAAGTTPYSVSIATNTSGQQIATVQVQYFTVIEEFLVNLTGGQTVTIASATTAAS